MRKIVFASSCKKEVFICRYVDTQTNSNVQHLVLCLTLLIQLPKNLKLRTITLVHGNLLNKLIKNNSNKQQDWRR